MFSSYRSALLTVALGVCVYYVGTFLITCLNAAFILTKIMRGLKPFPGPDKHWLYGNLHQVRDVAKLKKSIHPKKIEVGGSRAILDRERKPRKKYFIIGLKKNGYGGGY